MKPQRMFILREEGQGLTEYALILALLVATVVAALVLMGRSTGEAYETTLDAFEGDPGETLLIDNFDDRRDLKWQYFWGKWAVEDGRLKTTNGMWAKAVAPLPGPNYTMSMDMRVTSSDGKHIWSVTRVVFRFESIKNFYAVVPKTDGVLELAKKQNNKWYPWLAYANAGINPMQFHRYQVDVSGNHIQVWVDGKKYIDYTDPHPIMSGGIGVSNGASTSEIDNVEVRLPQPEEEEEGEESADTQ